MTSCLSLIASSGETRLLNMRELPAASYTGTLPATSIDAPDGLSSDTSRSPLNCANQSSESNWHESSSVIGDSLRGCWNVNVGGRGNLLSSTSHEGGSYEDSDARDVKVEAGETGDLSKEGEYSELAGDMPESSDLVRLEVRMWKCEALIRVNCTARAAEY